MKKRRVFGGGFDGSFGGGGGGGGKKKKAAEGMGKAESEEEEEEDRKMMPSEHGEMMELNKTIKALEAEIEGYKTERSQCTDEENRKELLRAITAARNNLTELLQQQTARAEQGRFKKNLQVCLSQDFLLFRFFIFQKKTYRFFEFFFEPRFLIFFFLIFVALDGCLSV